jgi:hypothetical protein
MVEFNPAVEKPVTTQYGDNIKGPLGGFTESFPEAIFFSEDSAIAVWMVER